MSKRVVQIMVFSLVLFFLLIITFYSSPIWFYQKIEDIKLQSSGVEFKNTNHFHYFFKDNCKTAECRCVLLIHGLGDFAYTWSQSLRSEKFQNIKMFAVNLPGSLESPLLESDSDYTVQNIASLIQKDILPMCESWSVVGNSFGGWIAVRLAESDKRIQSLILNSPAGLKKDYSHITEYFMNPTLPVVHDFYLKAYARPQPVPDFIFENVAERSKKMPITKMLKAVQDEHYIQKSIELGIPIQILWGDKDKVLLTDWASEYQSYLVGSQLEIIRDCGHIPQKECFTDFENTVVKFLGIN